MNPEHKGHGDERTVRGVHDNDTDETGFATPEEAARFLRISKSRIHKLIVEEKIPVCRWGRAVRIRWGWLLAQGDPKKKAGGSGM